MTLTVNEEILAVYSDQADTLEIIWSRSVGYSCSGNSEELGKSLGQSLKIFQQWLR